jgi:hypothetical protein
LRTAGISYHHIKSPQSLRSAADRASGGYRVHQVLHRDGRPYNGDSPPRRREPN